MRYLVMPENLDEWVFIGRSPGMGYSQENFDPAFTTELDVTPSDYRARFGSQAIGSSSS